jgi:hypothetical protein
MSKKVRSARKKLKFVAVYKHRLFSPNHPHSLRLISNVLSNLFGPPYIQQVISEKKPGRLYWKVNSDGKWAKIGNQFLFIDKEHMELADQYKSLEYRRIY